jgi:glycolate oxidase FAD binding subunit
MIAVDPLIEAFAAEVGSDGPVAVAGGRTRWDVGGALDPGARVLAAPSGVVDHQPDEMVVRVRAGTPVAELAATLAASGQRCALPDRGGTVGGAIAIGENHVEVLGRGALRASVLQVRYVSAEGRVITGGGPTVKNVSGFDLPRLMTGSLGTLGLLAEVILRSDPIPAVSVWTEAEGVDPLAVRAAVLRPSCVLWDGHRVRVLLEGHAPDVTGQLDALSRLGRFTECDGPLDLPAHRWSLTPADALALSGTDRTVVSVGVGTAWRASAQPPRPVSAPVREISERLKSNFDPTGRLNPGRCVWI